ncbi:MAG: NAD(P)-binding domain-containing protein [Acidobacteriia bacterium]|nr:NAD(P)-binding domain-containing protein [Terriglobia bacterium]
MDTLITVLVASLVTLFFVRGYLKKLTAKKPARPAAAAHAAPSVAPAKTIACPRCAKPIGESSAFCSHCGAALAMWSVHRAAVNAPSDGAKGKPKPVINASLCIGCGSCIEACPETGALELVGGKAILTHPDRCTGHAKCAEVCPTQGILYSYDGALQTVRVPLVKENFETNVPGVFIVGELGGMGLIKTAVNEGKLVMDHVHKRVGKTAKPAGHGHGAEAAAPGEAAKADEVRDVLIVGAGPAGLSAALTAHQYGLNYLAIEQGEIASTIRHYPRQKFLMAEPLEIPLYGPLYVSDGTKEALLSVWETIVANTGVRVQTNERVERVARNTSGFAVETSKGQYHAKNVILALGRRGTPRSLGVPGEDLGKVAYALIEAESYENKEILIVGGGDSALEAAVGLSKHKRNRVTLSYRGENFQRARERNQKFIAEAEAQGLVSVQRNSQVREIREKTVVLDVAGKAVEIANDYVFILIGGVSPEEFLKKTGIEIVEKSLAVAADRSFN